MLLQVSPELASEILKSGSPTVTGWGIALFVSLSFNFLLWYELRSVHNRFIDHLVKSDELLSVIHSSILSNK